MPKFFRFPWASTGDKTSIPDTAPPSGAVSYPQGFGPDYERDPATDPLAKRVPRDETNQLYYDITSNLQAWQLANAPEWVDAAQNGGVSVTYPINALVRYNNDVYYSIAETDGEPSAGPDWVLWNYGRSLTPPYYRSAQAIQDDPPLAPTAGQIWIVGLSPTGAWVGHENDLAEWSGVGWTFDTPMPWMHVGLSNKTDWRWDNTLTTPAWVRTGVIYADETYTVGTGQNFETIQDAIDWLQDKMIVPSATVTMSIASGNHNISGVVFDAPYLKRVVWQGANLNGSVPTYALFNPTNTNGADIDRVTGEAALRAIWPTRLICSIAGSINLSDLRLKNLLFLGVGSSGAWTGLVSGLPEFGGSDAQLWLENVHFHGFGGNGLSVRGGTLRASRYWGASRCSGSGLLFANGSIYQGSVPVVAATCGSCITALDTSNVEFTGAIEARGCIGNGSLDGCIVATGNARLIARYADIRFSNKSQAVADSGGWLDVRFGRTNGNAVGFSVLANNGSRIDARDQATVGATFNITPNVIDTFGSLIRSN